MPKARDDSSSRAFVVPCVPAEAGFRSPAEAVLGWVRARGAP
ncbi:Uncharacterised protein [Mycobacteroides abscessus subsp. abscessus]|nr:Uncharacterised protein [Mycobacteroides abscessus subsp. abscessus]